MSLLLLQQYTQCDFLRSLHSFVDYYHKVPPYENLNTGSQYLVMLMHHCPANNDFG